RFFSDRYTKASPLSFPCLKFIPKENASFDDKIFPAKLLSIIVAEEDLLPAFGETHRPMFHERLKKLLKLGEWAMEFSGSTFVACIKPSMISEVDEKLSATNNGERKANQNVC